MSRKPDPKSRSGFVRANPTLSVEALVSKAKAAGLKISPKLVYGVRARQNAKARGGPRSPRVNTRPADSSHYLVIEIERIIERKVNALLTERLGALFV